MSFWRLETLPRPYVLVVEPTGRQRTSLSERSRYPLPEETRQLRLILRDAVQQEREALILHRQTAELCRDEKLRELLKCLSEDEARHEKLRIQHYDRRRESYGNDARYTGNTLIIGRPGPDGSRS